MTLGIPSDYQAQAFRTAKVFPYPSKNLYHAGLGMLTEMGEIASNTKRIQIYQKDWTGMMENIREEVGDFLWYVALAATYLKIDLASFDWQAELLSEATDPLSETDDLTAFSVAGASACSLLLMASVEIESFSDGSLNLAVALGLYAVHRLSKSLPLDITEICQNNIAKLRERFPEKYTDELAEARLDKGGLDHTQS